MGRMIFNAATRRILLEWIKDFDALGSVSTADLLPLQKAIAGLDVKTTYVSHIVNLAAGNLRLDLDRELAAESKLVLKEIRNHYDIFINDSTITLTKRQENEKSN